MAPAEIERIGPLGADDFRRRYVKTSTPVILTGTMEDWPARQKWSPDYFRKRYGDRVITVGRTDRGGLVVSAQNGIPQQELLFATFLEMLDHGRPDYYLLSPVNERLAELMDDVRVPEVCEQARWTTSRIWMGARDTDSKLHRDWPENLFAQVLGRKQVILIDRCESSRLYSHSWHSKVPNYSQVDAANPDYERFPRFRNVPQARVTVEPGEVLYIPRMWWHQVRSLDVTVSINLWFGSGWVAAVAALSQAYARLRKLRV